MSNFLTLWERYKRRKSDILVLQALATAVVLFVFRAQVIILPCSLTDPELMKAIS